MFDSVEMLGIHFHTIDLVKGSSHIESPRWLKNKGATINPKNTKDNYCFKYAVTIALNHQELGNDPQRISKRLISLTSKYNCDGLDFPMGYKDDWSKFERKNKDTALNILSVPYNKEKVQVQYKSKYNHKRKKQLVLLMITDNKGTWHYLALKSFKTEDGNMNPGRSISRLMRGLSSKHHGEHYCLGCLRAYRTEKSLIKHERLCKNHDYCKVSLPSKGNNTLQHKFGTKSMKIPHMIYVDTESLLINHYTCCNNPSKSYTENIATHTPCGYSLIIAKSNDNEKIHSF